MAGEAGHGVACLGAARIGWSSRVRFGVAVQAWNGKARYGEARPSRRGWERTGGARRGWVLQAVHGPVEMVKA